MSPFRASAPLTDRWEHFRFSVSDGIGTVTLDRPGKLNALTFEAYADLRDLLAEDRHHAARYRRDLLRRAARIWRS
jgi:1,4-dihydroxy-2-naphthoyl-CoA synthase